MKNELLLRIKRPGLFSSIQDQGRFGHQSFGVPVGGAMDQRALQLANQILKNPITAPAIEITLMGPIIEMEGFGEIVITGAQCSPKINEQAILINKVIKVKSGDVLSFGKFTKGARAYIGVKGNWQCPQWLNSYTAINIEANNFGRLRSNDLIKVHASMDKSIDHALVIESIHDLDNPIEIMKGPEFEMFSNQHHELFLNHAYYLHTDSNRIGFRLNGTSMDFDFAPLISSPVVPGTIQITNEGLPIILMRDAQTTGGYPRIANVVPKSMDLLAQRKPGDKIYFKLLD